MLKEVEVSSQAVALHFETSFPFSCFSLFSSSYVEDNLLTCNFSLLFSFLFNTTSLWASSSISLNASKSSSKSEFTSISSLVDKWFMDFAIKHTLVISSSLEELEVVDALSSHAM